jgi:hypothetical protein
MEITVSTKHRISFYVAYFKNTESGMQTEIFKAAIPDLEQALIYLQLAKYSRPDFDWVIVIDVQSSKVNQQEYGIVPNIDKVRITL